jgi:hypothetical protein
MVQRVNYELIVEFVGAISGRLTARTDEENSAMMNLIQALSRAAIIMPSVKCTVTIIKKTGG